MELIPHNVEAYAELYTSPLDAVLDEIEQHTNANHPHANMLSGHVQGKVLETISSMVRPQRVLEIGTFTGFSALCLLKGMPPEAVLHTLELREEDAATAKGYFEKAGAGERIVQHTGDALDIIPGIKETWDLVFIDADKVNYINYYELTLPLLRTGGWIVADNVLFHGQVLEEPVTGKNAKAMDAFNKHVAKDERVQQVMLTVRDGLLIIQKK
jgi:caffeoyl-CoA O-methyltransferase